MVKLTRRQFANLPVAVLATGAANLPLPAFAQPAASLFTRPIPSTGEPLPSVGLGTAEVFDVTDTATLQKASAVDGPVSVRCYGRAVVLSLRYCW